MLIIFITSYITSLVLIYLITGSLYLWPPSSNSPHLCLWWPQFWSVSLWVCFRSIIDLQYYVSSWYTAQWFFYIRFKKITTPPRLFIDSSFLFCAKEGTIFNFLDSYPWLQVSLCLDIAPSVLSLSVCLHLFCWDLFFFKHLYWSIIALQWLVSAL